MLGEHAWGPANVFRDVMSGLERLRSARARIAGLAGSVRALPYNRGLDLLRGFLGESMLRLDGFSVGARRLIYLAYALIVVMTLWLLSLLLVEDGRSAPAPPSFVASLLVFTVFSVAWGLLLTGALYARRAVRRGALFLYLIVTAVWIVAPVSLVLPVQIEKPLFSWLSVLALLLLALVGTSLLLAVPVFFVLRRRTQLRSIIDFAVLSLLVFETYMTIYLQIALMPDPFHDEVRTAISGITLLPLLGLIGLLFVVLGLDLAEMLYGVAGLATVFAGSQLRRRLLGGLLLLVLACQLFLGVRETVESMIGSSFWRETSGNVAALGFPCIALIMWWLLERRRGPAPGDPLTVEQMFEVAKKWALLIVVAFLGIGEVASLLLLPLFLIGRFLPEEFVNSLMERLYQGINTYFGAVLGIWFFFAAVLALVVGILMARRGHRAAALYLTVLGGNTLLFLSALSLGWWPERVSWARVDFW